MDIYQIPHDAALELHILSAMMYEPKCITEIADIVKPRFFYIEKYGKLCESILDAWKENEAMISLQYLSPAIQETGIALNEIIEGMRSIATTGDIRYLGTRLRDIAALRAAVKVAHELIEKSTVRDSQDIRDLLASIDSKMSKISNASVPMNTMRHVRHHLMDYHEALDNLVSNGGGGITGKATGYRDLDNMLAGLQDGDLIILAARPSVGKTALSLEIAEHIAENYKKPTAYFSLEMGGNPLVGRMIASKSKIDATKLRSGFLDEQDWDKYTMGVGRIGESNLYIDDQPGMTVSEMKAKLRQLHREHGLSAVFVDYLGLIKGDKNLNRYDLVSENTRELKNLAREFKVPVVCLCQLSRGVEQRQDKRPMMSDLRESGEIEQTADVIAFLYRDDYYDKETEKKNIIEVIIAKQRNGSVGTVELAFLKNYNSFMNLDRPEQYLPPKKTDANKVKRFRRT